MKLKSVIGLMSGTSMDGIDASLVYTNGEILQRTNFSKTIPYSEKTKSLLFEAVNNPVKFLQNKEKLNTLDSFITNEHVLIVQEIMNQSSIIPFLIGLHGQTIFHNPKNKITVQLGDGQKLANLLKIDVVDDFRTKDIEFGGQGAPIAPIYHQKIIESMQLKLPSTIINIGGIANITYFDKKTLIGFDIGPGNSLMDFHMQKFYNLAYDHCGKLASKGKIDKNLVDLYLNDNFFKTPPPKSLERSYLFRNKYFSEIINLNSYDCLATLCEISCLSIKRSFDLLPKYPNSVLIVGGGENNKFLVKKIKETLKDISVYTGKEVGIPSNFI